MRNVALIDGDTVLYASAYRGQEVTEFGTILDITRAMANLRARIETILEACDADDCVIALSCPSRVYFRHKIWPKYKAHRSGGNKPELLGELTALLKMNYQTDMMPGLEADDVLGILATRRDEDHAGQVIVSSDKDLKQIPGMLLNPDRLDDGVRYTTTAQGDRWHLFQTLVGDQVDGYPGCPMIGKMKATKILDKDCHWEAVVAAFEKRGLTEEDALVQARVARILRDCDWDKRKKEPILWTPTSN